jgi:tRNA threonylcarbamoyladenosine dehydratase
LNPKVLTTESELPEGIRIVNAFDSALEELFTVKNPSFKKQHQEYAARLREFLAATRVDPVWVLYPADAVAVKTVPEDVYLALRTARNRNVIAPDQQEKYRTAFVGIAGLSVGSAALNALVISGGPKRVKIADFDAVEITNLNRIRARLTDAGANKIHVAARETYYLDPFAELDLYDSGLNQENVSRFLLEPRLDIFVEEMDSIDLKIMSRILCRENRIPVIMATDNGDDVILDIERFDQEPEREIFHGLIGHMEPEQVRNLDYRQWLELATKIVGPEHLTESMQDSLMQIGKTIPSVPQLGTTAAVAGAAIALAVRRIACEEPMPSGRYAISMESVLVPGHDSPESAARRQSKLDEFKAAFGKR